MRKAVIDTQVTKDRDRVDRHDPRSGGRAIRWGKVRHTHHSDQDSATRYITCWHRSLTSKMMDLQLRERKICGIHFSGKQEDWMMWLRQFMAKARKLQYKDILTGDQ